MRRALGKGLLGASLAVLAACGSEERLTADEFREQANAICAEGTQRMEAKVAELVGPDAEDLSDEQLDELADIVADEFDTQIHDLRALAPPEELEDDVDAALDSAEDAVNELEEIGGELFTSDEDPFEDANARLTELGLTACDA